MHQDTCCGTWSASCVCIFSLQVWKGCSPVVVWTASCYTFCAFCRTAGHRAGNPPHMPVSLPFSVWYMRSDIVLPWGWYGVDHSSWILLLLQKCLNEQELNSLPLSKISYTSLASIVLKRKNLTILMDPRDHFWKINGNLLQNLNVLAIICSEGSALLPCIVFKGNGWCRNNPKSKNLLCKRH